jgi:hypothetical protein
MPLIGAPGFWSAIQECGGPYDLGTDSDACIAFTWTPNVATLAEIFGGTSFIEK